MAKRKQPKERLLFQPGTAAEMAAGKERRHSFRGVFEQEIKILRTHEFYEKESDEFILVTEVARLGDPSRGVTIEVEPVQLGLTRISGEAYRQSAIDSAIKSYERLVAKAATADPEKHGKYLRKAQLISSFWQLEKEKESE